MPKKNKAVDFLKKITKSVGILFVLELVVIYFLPAVSSYSNIPNEIFIQKGASKTIDLGLPVKADLQTAGVVSISGETLNEATEFFLANSKGSVICQKDGEEKECNSYLEAKAFYS